MCKGSVPPTSVRLLWSGTITVRGGRFVESGKRERMPRWRGGWRSRGGMGFVLIMIVVTAVVEGVVALGDAGDDTWC